MTERVSLAYAPCPMGPNRKELFERIVDLIVATQELTRVTEENNRVSHALRRDLARIAHRDRRQRAGAPARSTRAAGGAGLSVLRLRDPK